LFRTRILRLFRESPYSSLAAFSGVSVQRAFYRSGEGPCRGIASRRVSIPIRGTPFSGGLRTRTLRFFRERSVPGPCGLFWNLRTRTRRSLREVFVLRTFLPFRGGISPGNCFPSDIDPDPGNVRFRSSLLRPIDLYRGHGCRGIASFQADVPIRGTTVSGVLRTMDYQSVRGEISSKDRSLSDINPDPGNIHFGSFLLRPIDPRRCNGCRGIASFRTEIPTRGTTVSDLSIPGFLLEDFLTSPGLLPSRLKSPVW
jgi:hypothetical protein